MDVLLAGIHTAPGPRPPNLRSLTGGQDRIEALAEAVMQPDRSFRPSVIVYPTWDDPWSQAAQGLQASMDVTQIVPLPTSLAPLGAAVYGRLLAELFHVLPAAVVLANAHVVSAQLGTGALLGSVTGMSHLSTSISKHMASWVPGQRFLALQHPEERLDRIKRKAEVVMPPLPEGQTYSMVATDETWAEQVGTAIGFNSGLIGVLPDESRSWWGTDELCEFVLHPHDSRVLAQGLHSDTAPRACDWCGQPTVVPECVWCGYSHDTAAA